MFYLDQETQRRQNEQVGGRALATFGDVYSTRRAADIAGGQTWSEEQQYRQLGDRTADLLEQFYGVRPYFPMRAVRYRSLNDNTLPTQDLEYNDYETSQTVRVPLLAQEALQKRGQHSLLDSDASWNELVDRAREEFPQYAKDLIRTDELVPQVMQKIRDLETRAQSTSSRATGFTATTGELAAGAVAAASEPANLVVTAASIPLALVAAPAATAALGGSLLLRLAGVAAFEGGINATSEFAIQTQMRDFYVRQGMTEEEADARVRRSIAGAALGGAVLGPIGYGIGKGLGKISEKTIGKLESGNPALLREALDEIETSGAKLTRQELADLANIRAATRFEDSLPSFINRTPANLRKVAVRTQALVDSLERGEITPQAQTAIVSSRRAELLGSSGMESVHRYLPDNKEAPAYYVDATDIPEAELVNPNLFLDDTRHVAVDTKALSRSVTKASKNADSVFSRMTKPQLAQIRNASTQAELITAVNQAVAGREDLVLTPNIVSALQELGFKGVVRNDGAKLFDAKGYVDFVNELDLPPSTKQMVTEHGADVVEAIRKTEPSLLQPIQPAPRATAETQISRLADGEADRIIEEEGNAALAAIMASDEIPDELKIQIREELDDIENTEQELLGILACMGGK